MSDRKHRPPEMEGIEGDILSGNIGNCLETAILRELDAACVDAKSCVRLIPGPDYTYSDAVAVDIQAHGLKPFPTSRSFTSYERLAWARANDTHGVMLEVKTNISGIKRNVDLYIFRPVDLPNDRVYAVPGERIIHILTQHWARRRMDDRAQRGFSHTLLAPYVVFRPGYVALMETLVLGVRRSAPYNPHNKLPPALPGVLTHPFLLAGCRLRPLAELFRFSLPTHEYSFQHVWELYTALSASGVELLRTATQPLAGDFLITLRTGERQVVIQHKVAVHSNLAEWFRPPSHFHFLFHHDPFTGQLAVYHEKSGGAEFSYNNTGIRALIRHLEEHFDAASRRLHRASAALPWETLPPPKPLPEDGIPRVQDKDRYNTARKTAHTLALSYCNWVNAGDGGDLPVAVTYLNWDQTHPLGQAFAFRHAWTPEERQLVREGRLPAALEAAQCLSQDIKGVVLRFACRDYHHRNLSSQHLPYQDRGAEMPATATPFLLLCAPDKRLPRDVPSSLATLPSRAINFPEPVYEEWRRMKDSSNHEHQQLVASGPLYTLVLQYGHATQQPQEPVEMLNFRLADAWVTREASVSQLHEVLEGGQVVIENPEARVKQTYNAATYLLKARDVLYAPLRYGTLRMGDGGHFRRQGWLYEEEKRQRKQRKETLEQEAATVGNGFLELDLDKV